ncbi:MAG: DUF4292 domain-containing protein [Saprospiraceae bacterium]|nr:DUF4292 domain-containing protein [Saprospiraceae bacterium]
MMTNIHHWFSIIVSILVVLTLLGCSASKKLSTVDAIKEKSSDYVLNAVQKGALTPDYLNARAKIKFDDGSTRISFNANIRIKRDSMIWMNASILGYEAARLLFRPDSIFMINRLEKSYVKDRYESIDSLFDVPVSFTQLQDLLLGNALLDESAPKSVDLLDDKYNISQVMEPYSISHQIDARSLQIDHIQVSDVRSGQQLDATLESYEPVVDLGNFSYIRQYIINKDNVQLANIQINYSHVDRDRTKKTPFSIPPHYSRSD